MQNKNMCVFAGTIVPSKKYPQGFGSQYFQNGSRKLVINLMVQDSYTAKDGQQKINKQYVDISFWGRKADEIEPQLTTGAFVEVVTKYKKAVSNGRSYVNFEGNKFELKAQGQPQYQTAQQPVYQTPPQQQFNGYAQQTPVGQPQLPPMAPPAASQMAPPPVGAPVQQQYSAPMAPPQQPAIPQSAPEEDDIPF